MDKMSKQFKLPSGKFTASTRRYLSEWRKLTDAVEQRLGARVYAFDPGVAVSLPDGRGGCSLPLWVAQKIADLPTA
jgi:hypothetical protein